MTLRLSHGLFCRNSHVVYFLDFYLKIVFLEDELIPTKRFEYNAYWSQEFLDHPDRYLVNR